MYIREELGMSFLIERFLSKRKVRESKTRTLLSTYFLFSHQSYLPLDKNRTHTTGLEQITDFLSDNCISLTIILSNKKSVFFYLTIIYIRQRYSCYNFVRRIYMLERLVSLIINSDRVAISIVFTAKNNLNVKDPLLCISAGKSFT